MFTSIKEFQKHNESKDFDVLANYVKEIKSFTNLREIAIVKFITDNKLSNEEVLNIVGGLGMKKLKPMDLVTAISGKADNKYIQVILDYAKSGKPFKK